MRAWAINTTRQAAWAAAAATVYGSRVSAHREPMTCCCLCCCRCCYHVKTSAMCRMCLPRRHGTKRALTTETRLAISPGIILAHRLKHLFPAQVTHVCQSRLMEHILGHISKGSFSAENTLSYNRKHISKSFSADAHSS